MTKEDDVSIEDMEMLISKIPKRRKKRTKKKSARRKKKPIFIEPEEDIMLDDTPDNEIIEEYEQSPLIDNIKDNLMVDTNIPIEKEYVEMIHTKFSTERSIYELQMDDIIREIEITYRGLKFDNEANRYFRDETSFPIMNDKGVNEIIKILKSFLHKGIFMTKFKDTEANNVFRCIGRALNIKLSCNWRNWSIHGQDTVVMIYNELLTNIKAGINRAINSDEKHYREHALGYNVGVSGKVPPLGMDNQEQFIGGI